PFPYTTLFRSCGLPAFAYNSPGRVGYGIPPAQLADLIRSCGLAGAKQAAPDISELADLVVDCGDSAAIVGGAEIAIWPALCVGAAGDRKSTRLNSSHQIISYAV